MKSMESSPEKKDKRLSEEDAHEQANMLKAHLKVAPETGRMPATKEQEEFMFESEGRETTAEDYDRALATLEKLENLAEKEPATEKVLNLLGRLCVESAEVTVGLLRELSSEVESTVTDRPLKYPEDLHSTPRIIRKLKKRFEDAAYKLRELKKGSAEYE